MSSNSTAHSFRRYVKEPLRLGDLWGNRFSVVLRFVSLTLSLKARNFNRTDGLICVGYREVSASEDQINEALVELKRTGFINYYGMEMERFLCLLSWHH